MIIISFMSFIFKHSWSENKWERVGDSGQKYSGERNISRLMSDEDVDYADFWNHMFLQQNDSVNVLWLLSYHVYADSD